MLSSSCSLVRSEGVSLDVDFGRLVSIPWDSFFWRVPSLPWSRLCTEGRGIASNTSTGSRGNNWVEASGLDAFRRVG